MASSGGNSLQMNTSYSFSNQFMASNNDLQPRQNNINKVMTNQNIDIEIPKSRPFSPSSFSISPSSFFATTPTFSPSLLLDSPVPFQNFNMASSSSQSRGSYEFPSQAGQPSHSIMVSSTVQPPSSNNSSSDQLMMRQEGEWAANTTNKQAEESARENIQQNQYSSQQNQVYHSSQYGKEQKSEDGYNWRKYGQKQVKASENPRSYYKCTYVNCPTKKMVERNLDGHITEIVYKGSHNHPKPQSTRRSSSQSSYHNPSFVTGSEMPNNHSNGIFDNRHIDSVATPERSSASFDDDDVDAGSRMSKSGDVNDVNEPEAKRWKGENEYEAVSASASRTVREPRIVVQTTSDIDILDDGYRWRKYGQKVVKGNPNPRSYYKCTFAGCQVRKHIERASQDLRAVITTYEGKHNHDVPAARGSARYNSNVPSAVNNNSIVTTAIRPSAINNHPGHGTNYSTSLHDMRQPTIQNQPFSLQMLQNSENLRFSGYGNSTNLNTSQYQQMNAAFSSAKEEPKDDSFFNSF